MRMTTPIRKNYEFRRLYQKGNSAVAPLLVLYVRAKKAGTSRLGITVSTKVGKAVVRNRVRRRIREIYRLHETEFAYPVDLVIVARVRAAEANYWQIERSFLSAAGKLGLLKEPQTNENLNDSHDQGVSEVSVPS